MKHLRKFTAILLAMLMLAVIPASVLAAESTDNSLVPTIAELKTMFPEAEISLDVVGTANGCEAFDRDAIPEKTYNKIDGLNSHTLEVFSDGSYRSYGNIVVEEVFSLASKSSSGTRSTGFAYADLNFNAYISFYYNYTTSNGSATITSVSNGTTRQGYAPLITWVFYDAVKSSSTAAYRRANCNETGDAENIITTPFYLRVYRKDNGTSFGYYLD